MRMISIKARLLLVTAAAAGALAVTAWATPNASAQQAPPVKLVTSFTVEGICDFNAQVDAAGKIGTIELPNGATLLTFPGLKATVTNLSNGNKISLTLPGTTKVLPSGEQIFSGPNLITRGIAFGDNVNALVYATGRYTFVPGRVPGLQGSGPVTNLCETLK